MAMSTPEAVFPLADGSPVMGIQVTTRDGGFGIGGARLGKPLSYAVAAETIHIGTQDRFKTTTCSTPR
jgi:hypothetical protein